MGRLRPGVAVSLEPSHERLRVPAFAEAQDPRARPRRSDPRRLPGKVRVVPAPQLGPRGQPGEAEVELVRL